MAVMTCSVLQLLHTRCTPGVNIYTSMHVQHVFMLVVSFWRIWEPGYENHLGAQLKFRLVRFLENGEAAITRAVSRMAKSRQLCIRWPGLVLSVSCSGASYRYPIWWKSTLEGKNSR